MLKKETENSRALKETAEHLSDAIAALQRGDVIVFPTETLYGLGADALNSAAVERVFQLKGRDPTHPIPVLVADRGMLFTLVADLPTTAQKLMDRFWPGPLTLVLPARKDIPQPLLNPTGAVGVRISSQPIATRLVRGLGRPLTATSANPSGQPPARTIDEAKNYFAGKVNVFVDGGTLSSQTGSTVAEITNGSVTIIREGAIRAVELEQFLKESVGVR